MSDELRLTSRHGNEDYTSALRDEASVEPDPVATGPVKKDTQIIAIYGKGGIGKSFTLANLSCMMAEQGKKVLLIGCDPKSDTTSLLFGGKACPTIIETSSKKKLAGEEVAIGDVCFKRYGVFAMELGGPEVGRGCGGRGIIHGFELLEKLGFHEWDFDYVLLDFLGDVVCGGFGLPIARDMCQKVIVVGSNDLQSLYVANNVCSAVEYFRKMGGNVGVAGMVINRDDGTGEAAAFANAVGIPVLATIPANDDIRRKSANYQIVGTEASEWGALFSELAANIHGSVPNRPNPLTSDGLLGLFSSKDTGGDIVLEPATVADMCGIAEAEKRTLEVVYEAI
ncbi:chlorophyllide a reductase iron protein subunit X [Hyphomonas sp.]|jgi:chlorophyllide a reductase subunit X|uniref:chlorophyllide a reductase iron protein subunit X n=1 Tax=Hyphomonas sp. TaxID=87 RepID=UPI000B32815F|nr:chlorophyllide a reductase iron protein subunit X [Hyphomonas sp.]MBA4339309.1 chlorophyllide a reductase iron protein subunit X [Hyphomonas sp.]